VADEQDGPALATDLAHLAQALTLEGGVAYREHLVHDQDLGLEVSGDREREPQVHAARVALHRRVDEALDLGEGDDLVELALDLAAAHAEDRAVQEDVLATREIAVEARPDLEERPDTAADARLAVRRLGDAREDLEQRRLAGPVAPDDAEDVAARDVERDVVERPQDVPLLATPTAREVQAFREDVGERVAHASVQDVLLAEAVALGEVANLDGVLRRCLRTHALSCGSR
jgi:hypothetical protein